MSNKLSFQHVVNDIIKNHFFNLIKINLFFSIIIFIVYTFLPKTYYADTSLTQSGNSADSILGNTRSLANTVGINLPNNSFSDFFYIPNIIYSKSCIESILLKTRDINGETTSLHDFWTNKRILISGKSEQQLLYDSILKFEERIIIDEDFKSGMFTIGFHSNFEELSLEIIEDLIKYINNFINNTASEKSSSLSKLYNQKLLAYQEKLTFAEENLKNFAEKNKNYQNSPELLIEFERLNRQVILENDRYLNVFVQNTLAEIEEEKNVPKINILSKPYIHPKVYSPDLFLILLVGLSIVNVSFLTIYLTRKQID